METLKCIIVDDDVYALDRMEELIKLNGNVKVLAKIDNPKIAVQHLSELNPDLIFLDVEMPGMTGFELMKAIHKQNFFPEIIFVTAYDKYAIKAIKAAAFDYILKPVDLDELNESIQRFLDRKINKNYVGYKNLTEREKIILDFVSQGKTSHEIGAELYISKHTVDTHRRNIKKKRINNR